MDGNGHEPGPAIVENQPTPPLARVGPYLGDFTCSREAGPGGAVMVVLRAEHAIGSTVLVITPEVARALANMLIQAATGIIVAQ